MDSSMNERCWHLARDVAVIAGSDSFVTHPGEGFWAYVGMTYDNATGTIFSIIVRVEGG